ncbi:hypothetical protein SCLCIDRAFT_1214950, partial [Scleroderma citrinum Foug A]
MENRLTALDAPYMMSREAPNASTRCNERQQLHPLEFNQGDEDLVNIHRLTRLTATARFGKDASDHQTICRCIRPSSDSQTVRSMADHTKHDCNNHGPLLTIALNTV